jgi:site-specific DNA-methyltransferase (adenine-specific)
MAVRVPARRAAQRANPFEQFAKRGKVKRELFIGDRIELYPGDSRDVLRALPDSSIDSIVTDPPYALVSIVKRFGAPNAAPAKGDVYNRASAGFMGKQWDTGETAFAPEFWAECLRVLKPGGHVVAFSGTRTYHRMTCAIEDAGFEVRDMLSWLYGSGFPKSHNIGDGWGTALKPACEPICFGRKPLIGTVAANVLKHGTGAINVDGCRVAAADKAWGSGNRDSYHELEGRPDRQAHRYGEPDKNPDGRWPANVIHDGSEEVVEAFPDAPGQQRGVGPQHGEKPSINVYGDYGPREQFDPRGDSGSAARFFYTAKADAEDRIGSKHPTVKPIDLMQWLVRLVTPKGGIVLDPFAGTGTTAEAAFREGMRCILIEREEEYQDDIRRRMALLLAGPEERARESIKAKLKDKPVDAGPLFGGVE